MAEKGILFSAPMVRALIAGTKTQTRRAVKWRNVAAGLNTAFSGLSAFGYGDGWRLQSRRGDGAWEDRCGPTPCRYGKPGDRLWVREAWRACVEADAVKPRDMDAACRVWYEADAPHQPGFGKYRPPMFMPRLASRITLELTEVRVERLQEISHKDAVAEGIEVLPAFPPHEAKHKEHWHTQWRGLPGVDHNSSVDAYRDLWEQINGAGSWDLNPWVWVLSFRRTGGDR